MHTSSHACSVSSADASADGCADGNHQVLMGHSCTCTPPDMHAARMTTISLLGAAADSSRGMWMNL